MADSTAAPEPATLPYDQLLQPLLAEPAGPPLGTVAAGDIAHGVYAAVSGVLPDDRQVTLTGYVIGTRDAVAGFEGWAREDGLAITLAAQPDALDGVTIAVPADAQAAVLTPPPGAPDTPDDWRQMPVDEQVRSALAELGLSLRRVDEPPERAGWQIPGIDRVFSGHDPYESMATFLFGDDVWRGRTTPLLRQSFVDEAIADGRWQRPRPLGPTPVTQVRAGAYGTITGEVDGVEQSVTGEFDRVYSLSHGTRRRPNVFVAVTVTDPEAGPGSSGRRVVTVAVPATGTHFTLTARPSDPTPAAATTDQTPAVETTTEAAAAETAAITADVTDPQPATQPDVAKSRPSTSRWPRVFDADQRAHIRDTVAEHAADLHDGPRSSTATTARRLAEGPLAALSDRYGLGPVLVAVGAVLDDEPALLTSPTPLTSPALPPDAGHRAPATVNAEQGQPIDPDPRPAGPVPAASTGRPETSVAGQPTRFGTDHLVSVTAAARFRPTGQHDLAPSGETSRIRANLAALRTLRTVQAEQRPATGDEQQALARWSGWGAVPAALDPGKPQFDWVRTELADLLDEQEMAAARRTVINAHYTDAALVQTIWQAVTDLGFTGGRVLEPGCGAGNFLAFAPDGVDLLGVELDPTTAAIAAALHPHADIRAESFAATRLRTASIDLTIGNVPFGDVRLHDRQDNSGNHSIHNHFILKSLRATRPGGLVAVITSAYTMDALNPSARREMQQMADLVGAVRLPSRAHARAAGTDALTDVLVLRRREDDREPEPFDWEYTATTTVDGVDLTVNAYFQQHPQYVLGQLAAGRGLYRDNEVVVTGDPQAAPEQLRQALQQVCEHAEQAGLTMTEAPAAVVGEPRPAALLPATTRLPDGYLRASSDGTFARLDDGAWEPYAPPKTQAAELRALLGLRDNAVALLEAEAASLDDTDDIDRLRAGLNTRYDAYVAAHGPINRFTEVAARRRDKATGAMVPAIDEETGEPITRRKRPPAGGFRHDPFAPVVRALEIFDEESQTAAKADIFTQRVVAPRAPRLGADTPEDALAISMDDYGEVRLDAIAWLLGIDEQAARPTLGTLVFDDPATGRIEPAAAYLSGDVKTKLSQARAAADDDAKYTPNVVALTEVVPRDLGPDEIVVKMGAPWIGAAYIQQFLTEILDDDTITVEHGGAAMWSVDSNQTGTVAATSTWGTDRRDATEIAQHILEQREFVIKDTVGSGSNKRQVVNVDAIMAATEKAVEMRERFADWVWEDADRAADLVAKYNDIFQRYVPRSYDDVHLSLPGLAMAFKPDKHQVAAVARIIHEPAVGLYHAVGAGKTASMIMGTMELRRLGLAQKPVIVVPNQLLDQWTREFLRLYPQAKLLAASTDDLAKDRRRLMVARMATGDWDAVILTETAFEMLPMTPAAEQAYVDAQMAELDERIDTARNHGAETTLKRLETLKANRESRLEERLDTDQDAGIWWELTGIDYIFRDESHRDKNLRTVSNVSGMSIKGSQRAQQMDMKLAWLRERQPRWGTRATGTPIANSIVELFTEFRFLRPDLMAAQGITDIDSFLATYAEGEVVIEVTPDGGGLRNKTRFKFVNLDELITPTRVFADVKTKDDLGLVRPPLAARPDGQRVPEPVLVAPSEQLLVKVDELVRRAADLKGKKAEKGADNILKIVGEGAAAALDLHLVGMDTDEPQKLDAAADRIAAIYHASADTFYPGKDGAAQPLPGALQMVFCDLGTPSATDPGRWTSYGKLRTLLAEREVPVGKVKFIHEAKDDRQRAELFAACRDGRVAVLIGSTEKMGTGVNVQDRLLAMHHLDPPWRPCDLEQRDGRIDRRGNLNPEIHILRYVTERSLDAFKWQKIAYKARLADQILLGRAGREVEDIGEVTLSHEEMKAAATGNPLLVDHAKAKADLTRLERLERGYHRNRSQLQWTVRASRQEISINQTLIAEADTALTRRTDTRGNAFTMTVRDRTFNKRSEANDRLKGVLGLILADPANLNRPAQTVGTFGGFTITAKADTMHVGMAGQRKVVTGLLVELAGAPGTDLRLLADDLTSGDLATRLENRLAKLDSVRDSAAAEITRRQAEIARAEQELTKPFRHEQALAAARETFQQLDIQVIALAAAADAETGAGEPADGEPVTPAPEPARLAGIGRSGSSRPAIGATAVPPPPAAPPQATVAQLLADSPLSDQQRQWLTDRLAQLAADPHLQDVARNNIEDNARLVLDEQIPELFVDAYDTPGIDGEGLATWFFDSTTDNQIPFVAAAGRELYEQARTGPGSAATAAAPEETAGIPAQASTSSAAAAPVPTAEQVSSGHDEPLQETQRVRRGHDFYPPAAEAAGVPGLYATERQEPGDKILHLHYFGGSADAWLAEYDPATGDGFGYISLGDPDDAEWGYVHLPELEQINRGLVIIERDLYWTPVRAAEANLPGRRAPRPAPALNARQQAALTELDKPLGEPWRIGREWKLRTYLALPTDEMTDLPQPTRDRLMAEVTALLDSPAVRERATARRLLDRWNGAPESTPAVERALDALCFGAHTYQDLADPARMARYSRLTAAEFLALDPGYRDDIRADLKTITQSGATKTIPRNRSATGATVRTTADHVTAADNLLRRLGNELTERPFHSHADQVGQTITGLNLNPGDQIEVGRKTVTVDRVGLDLNVHLQELTTPIVGTRRYRLLAAAPDPADADSGALGAVAEATTSAPTPEPATSESPTPAAPSNPTWLDGVTFNQQTPAGSHQVQRTLSRRGDTITVEARHPQLGMLPRGRLHLSEPPAPGQPATWQLIDPDSAEIATHTGTYLDAEAHLLAATAGLDEPLDPAELAEATDPDEPAQQVDVAQSGPDDGNPAPPEPGSPAASPASSGAAAASTADTSTADTSMGATSTEAAAQAADPSWAAAIQIVEGATTRVTGTTGAPREERLRGLLKQYGFRYQRSTGEWRFAGRSADLPAALADVRRWLQAQQRATIPAAGRRVTLPPTEQQQKIITAFLAGQTVAVQALAGTGKTSTLLMLAAARPDARFAYVAFNRSIADEAQRKFGRNVRADTSHAFAREGLAGSALQPKLARVGKGLRWAEEWAEHLDITGIETAAHAVEPETLARMATSTVKAFRESAADTITVAHLPRPLPEGIPGLGEAVLQYAQAAWADITDPAGKLLFDHDDYLKVWALGHPRLPADVVLFDEAQDINDVLRKVIQDQPMQAVVVGDSNQSIYGFRGAIDALKHWPAEITLPLTQSWRFGPEIAELGNRFLQLLRSPWLLTGNPSMTSTLGPVDEPDAVLARTNAGAVAAVFDAVDASRSVALVGGGRAIQDIAQAAKDLQAGRRTKHPELSRFADWDAVRAFCEDGGEDAQSLRAFVRLVDRRGSDALLRMVKDLIDEDDTGPDGRPGYDVIVSTAHKSKGREWDHVRIAEDFPQPKEDLDTGEITLPGAEELRLAYVTVTRAKNTLELGSLSWIRDLDDLPPRGRPAAITEQPAPAADDRPALPAEPTSAPAAGAGPGPDPRPLSEVELTVIANAVADHAAGYYGGPAHLDQADAARYTTEAHLGDLIDQHGFTAIHAAVAAAIAANPTVLERSEKTRTDNRIARHAAAEGLAQQVLGALHDGEPDAALRLIGVAERLDPTYRPARADRRPAGATWDELRDAARRHQPGPGTLDDWLATQPARLRDGLPGTARRWLEQQIAVMTADPAVIVAARAARHPGELAGLVDQRLLGQITRREGWHQPEARNGQFFTDYLDNPAVQNALHDFARRAVFASARPSTATPASVAQLARLDTAPGAGGPGTSGAGVTRDPYASTPGAAGRQAGGPRA